MRIFFTTLAIIGLALSAAAQTPLTARWEMGSNDTEKKQYTSRLILKNTSGATLTGDWTFYFNQFSRTVTTPAACPVDVKEISTTYYRVKPNALYKPLKSGDSLVVDLTMKGTMVNICYVPQGGHLVIDGATENPIPVKIDIAPLDKPGQWIKRDDYPDGKYVYEWNEKINPKGAKYTGNAYDIFPTPKNVVLDQRQREVTVPSLVSISTRAIGTNRAKNYLRERLQRRGVYVSSGQPFVIEMKIDHKLSGQPQGYYVLTVNDDGAVITAETEDGLLNGAKTLVAAIDHTTGRRLPHAVISDYPDLQYRGFMMDIARNFFGLDELKQLVDILAYYKVNNIQFHFTDDEAWRVEIPDLPELTQIASRRGCTETENNFLAQIFDGNGNPNDLSQSANGYLTREQFIDFLKYAHASGIKVIPEIETPGHARAAIVAMTARYNDLMAAGDTIEARRYQLVDPNDKRDYASVQSYRGNVLNPAMEGTYNFIDKVVTELAAMYKKAGLKLDIVHLGGDEVAQGAWNGSPAVKALMSTRSLADSHAVSEYYISRVSDMLAKRGIAIEGWQEVAMNHGEGFNRTVAPRVAGVNVWNTLGSKASLPKDIAAAGYPVILSCSHHFYVDMGYSWHQYEKGLHWSGAVNEFDSWQPLPAYDDPAARKGIIGVQAQLFGETLRNWPQVQYYILPKLLGLVERGWNAEGDTGDKARVQYNLKIGQREIPMYKARGLNFHVPQPGIKVEGSKLLINTPYPAMTVHYTLDGSEPTVKAPVWTSPVNLPKGSAKVIKAKAFYQGKESLTTYLWM